MYKVSLLGVLSILSACQLAPQHERPELPTAIEYPQEYVADPDGGTPAAAIAWQDFFADPRLVSLLDMAHANNRDLAIAVARVAEARNAYGVQRADRVPTVGIDANASRSRSTVGMPAVPVTTDRYALGIGISAFELDFWGRVRNLSGAARSNYLASMEGMHAFQLVLTRDVAAAYLALLESQERIALAERTVRARSDQMGIAGRRLDAGVTSELEFRQAETLLTQAETELAALRLSSAQNHNLLNLLVGQAYADSLPPALPLGEQLSRNVLGAGLPSGLLEVRPDIRAAEQRLIAARANIGVARAAFFPSIRLTGNAGFASSELDDLTGGDNRAWNFGPSIDLPIFDLGRRRGNAEIARAREAIAIADYERVVQTAFREVADALAGRRYLAEQVAAQERGIVAQRRLAELARKRYNEGVVRYLEVLDAERSLFASEQALLQVRRTTAANDVALYIALGGGVRNKPL